MKKKMVQLLLTGCCIGMLAGCAKVGENQNNPSNQQTTQTQQTEEKKQEEKTEENNKEEQTEEEKHTIAGTIAGKKDFMVTIEDESKTAYVLAFDEKPEGYDDLKVGDYVQAEYTGELSETEAFTGKVLSIKKVEKEDSQ